MEHAGIAPGTTVGLSVHSPNILRSLLKLTPGTLALGNQVTCVIFWFRNLTVTLRRPDYFAGEAKLMAVC